MTLWPVQPLLDYGRSERQVYDALHLSGTTWKRIRTHGLTTWQADRAAIRLGLMPHCVWDDWVDAGLTVVDRDYLAGGWRTAWLWQEAS